MVYFFICWSDLDGASHIALRHRVTSLEYTLVTLAVSVFSHRAKLPCIRSKKVFFSGSTGQIWTGPAIEPLDIGLQAWSILWLRWLCPFIR